MNTRSLPSDAGVEKDGASADNNADNALADTFDAAASLYPDTARIERDRNPWPLKVVTYNIHGAIGGDRRFAPNRIAEVLQEIDADVIALQEVPLGGAAGIDVLALLRNTLGFHAVEGPTEDSARRRYGNAVLSRYPVLATRAIDLSFGAREARGALEADIDCRGHALRVVATHLGLRPAERRTQIRQLLQAFDTDRMPVLLMGDVNEWFVWGRPLRWLVSHFEATPAPRTFPSRRPIFALDRIWIRPRHHLLQIETHASALARIASDHLPLVAYIKDLSPRALAHRGALQDRFGSDPAAG